MMNKIILLPFLGIYLSETYAFAFATAP